MCGDAEQKLADALMKYIHLRELKRRLSGLQINEISSGMSFLRSSFLGASANVGSSDLKLFFLCESTQTLTSLQRMYSSGQLIERLKYIIDTILTKDTHPVIDGGIIQSSFEDCGYALGECNTLFVLICGREIEIPD